MHERPNAAATDAIFPLYDQAALDAAVAAEHERCARLAQEARRQFNHWASQRAHAEGSVLRLKVLDALAEIAGPNVRANLTDTAR